MKKVFLDSSVLVAACASLSGASAFILGYSRKNRIRTFVSLDVVGEARHNVHHKLNPEAKNRLIHYLKKARLELVASATTEEVAESERHIHPKDAPILAAAKQRRVQFLVTLDRKHFLQPKVKIFAKPIEILTPGDFVKKYLKNK